MPDWTYHTVFKPVLFRLPYRTARRLALGSMSRLARLPLGPSVIDFFGHMKPAECLTAKCGDLEFPTRVGLGHAMDPELIASEALARFGIGFYEIGPITAEKQTSKPNTITLDIELQRLRLSEPAEFVSRDDVADWLTRNRSSGMPVILRIAEGNLSATWPWELATKNPASSCVLTWSAAELLSLDEAKLDEVISEHERRSMASGCRMLLVVSAGLAMHEVERLAELLSNEIYQGLIIDGSLPVIQTHKCVPDSQSADALFRSVHAATRAWRSRLGPQAWIIAAGGIHTPSQAVALIDDGANLVEVDTGIVFAGPGLPKRINAALQRTAPKVDSGRPRRPAQQGWFWTLLMGISMLAGGLLALAIAATQVVMPYDESLVGMTRQQIAAVNPRLLDFMSHDRVTLAGTMLAVGVLYMALSWFGGRRGMHWAHASIIWSAFTGFFTFFLFLGFGYFDPLHAFVTTVLFQFLLLALYSDLPSEADVAPPDLHNDWRWHWALWGQLLYIVHGLALVIAGCVICYVGISSVFVHSDLEFMQTTSEALLKAHPRLVPLVAHDRATFGGMLIACGLTVSLSCLWGFRRGHAWHWWALVIAGHAGYLTTLAVHLHVGYRDLLHLTPIYAGLTALWLAATVSYPFMTDQGRAEIPAA